MTLAITGGRVLRVESEPTGGAAPSFAVERADVLVDRETGTIREIGPDLAADGDKVLDASGGLVLPGLVNAHTHAGMGLLRGYADDKPLETWLREDIWPIEAEMTAEDIRAGAELAILEFCKGGVTAFSEMYFEVPQIAEAVEDSGIRAVLGHTTITVGKDEEGAHADTQESLDVALELDGAADGRIATTFQPHSLTTVEPAYLEEYVPKAREHDIPLHFHANETTDEVDPIVEEHGVRPLVYAAEHGMLEPGDALAHCVHVDEEEIALLAESGVGVAHCPAANMKLASGIAPVQRMLDAGVTVGLGTDGPASNNDLSLFGEVRDAAMVGKLADGDASAVPAEWAVWMATAGGAAVLGIDGGRLEPDAPADLAVIDLDAPHLTPPHDLVSHLAYAASAADVRHTICDGQVLVRDREVQTLDERAVIDRAREHAAALVERVE